MAVVTKTSAAEDNKNKRLIYGILISGVASFICMLMAIPNWNSVMLPLLTSHYANFIFIIAGTILVFIYFGLLQKLFKGYTRKMFVAMLIFLFILGGLGITAGYYIGTI